MARGRRKKDGQTGIANSDSSGQLQDSLATQPSNPVASGNPSVRTRHQAKPKASDKPDKPADSTGCQEQQTSQKKRQPNMLRARNTNNTGARNTNNTGARDTNNTGARDTNNTGARDTNNTGPAPNTGQLMSGPEWFSFVTQQTGYANWMRQYSKKPSKTTKAKADTKAKDYTRAKADNKAKHYTTRAKEDNKAKKHMPSPSAAPLPWILDSNFPRPLDDDRLHSFNYNRQWLSLCQDRVREELLKHLANGRRARLPRLFHDSTDHELALLREKYSKNGQSRLYETRKDNRNVPQSSTPFVVSTMAKAGVTPINAENPLVRFLRVSELRALIVDKLNPSIRDVTALAATCTEVAFSVKLDYHLWDYNLGVFPTTKFVVQDTGVRASTLAISPVSAEPYQSERKPYMADFTNMVKLCAAIAEIPNSFKSIILDRIPFLNVSLVEMMINTMPNLKSIIITRCLLLDVTKLKPLLDVIQRHPRILENKSKDTAKSKPTREYIRLDFFPFFFRGLDSARRLGSYGVTHNEPTFHTPKAIFGLILQCWDLAREVDMDLLSDSSSFFSFVRQLPGPDIIWALKARDALITREHDLAAGRKNPELIRDNWTDDITAALTGDDHKPGVIPAHMAKRRPVDHHAKYYWRKGSRCGTCGVTYPRSLFPIRLETCWCCKMVRYVNVMEDSHLRLWQHSALDHWFSDLDPRTATIKDVLTYRPTTLDGALDDVQHADWVWNYYLFKFQAENQFSHPPPRSLASEFGGEATSMVRWRSYRNPVMEPFDYRKGGPQYQDPCKEQLYPTNTQDEDFGPESLENFTISWRSFSMLDRIFTNDFIANYKNRRRGDPTFAATHGDITSASDPRVRQAMAAAKAKKGSLPMPIYQAHLRQNKRDKEVYMLHHALAEDCLVSLFTLGNMPFNLDKPVLHPTIDENEYRKALTGVEWTTTRYSAQRNCW